MGWYGCYAVSTLCLANSVAEGGLGFSSDDRRVIQWLATSFLYLFPAVFGALAGRCGYRSATSPRKADAAWPRPRRSH